MFVNSKQAKWTILLLMVVALGANACRGASVFRRGDESAARGGKYYEHTVRYAGESLAIIAKWYTGDARNWSVLAKENPDVSPNTMRIGDLVQIPRSMVTNTEPMPRSFIASQTPKIKKAPVTKSATPRSRGSKPAAMDEVEASELEDATEPGSVMAPAPTAPEQSAPAQPKREKLDLYGPKE
jgi:hypothetical protein